MLVHYFLMAVGISIKLHLGLKRFRDVMVRALNKSMELEVVARRFHVTQISVIN